MVGNFPKGVCKMRQIMPNHREDYDEDLEDIEGIYDLEEMKSLLEDDEISSEEEAFMLGYIEH